MPADKLTFALAQLNFTVGDIAGNMERLQRARADAAKQKADLIVFPELATLGYPPEDLVLMHACQKKSVSAIEKLAKQTADGGPAVLVGGVWLDQGKPYNAAFFLDKGKVQQVLTKRHLPNYGVFDEKRVFARGDYGKPVNFRGVKLGVLICEDLWDERAVEALAKKDPEIVIAINASPYQMGKAKQRRNVAELAARATKSPLVYLNMVGGQDELVFDGRSFVLNPDGDDVVRLRAFEEELALITLEESRKKWKCTAGPRVRKIDDYETMYQALVLGLRDYVGKNGFPGVVIGMSGGIDSGLTAAIAVDALGPEKVHGLMMPSQFTSKASMEDAKSACKKLGIALHSLPIEPGMKAFDAMLAELFRGKARDTTEENIQARLRGHLLMAASNKHGWMVLTTGNKSELSVGYATLYGDMCGGYSVLKDVYKTTVYKLAKWRNDYPANPKRKLTNLLGPDGPAIPARMITKAPSAELKPNQTDQDTLPPYDLLDAILQGLIEKRWSVDQLVERGYHREVVAKVARMLYTAEYKRRQAPPGVKVTGMAFGRDRRYPITNRFEL